jgi:hypothetical protein
VLMQLWMEYWEVFHMSMNPILVAVMISWRLSYLNVFLLMLKPNHSLLLVFFFSIHSNAICKCTNCFWVLIFYYYWNIWFANSWISDCGSGIGRVTKNLLIRHFNEVS